MGFRGMSLGEDMRSGGPVQSAVRRKRYDFRHKFAATFLTILKIFVG